MMHKKQRMQQTPTRNRNSRGSRGSPPALPPLASGSSSSGARLALTGYIDLDVHKQTTKEIGLACTNLDRLLDELEHHAVYNPSNANERAELGRLPGMAEPEQVRGEVRRLRAFAADDTTMETTSVGDYAADPEVPDIFADTTFVEEVGQMQTAMSKVGQSLSVLLSITVENPQWWNSAILLRRIKTHAIRTNYHARSAKAWGDHLRGHMLVASTELNQTAMDARKELEDIQKQFESCAKRAADLESLKAALKKETADLLHEQEQVLAHNKVLRSRLLDIGAERRIFRPDEHRVEAILLLNKLAASHPPLAKDCQLLSSWLTSSQVVM